MHLAYAHESFASCMHRIFSKKWKRYVSAFHRIVCKLFTVSCVFFVFKFISVKWKKLFYFPWPACHIFPSCMNSKFPQDPWFLAATRGGRSQIQCQGRRHRWNLIGGSEATPFSNTSFSWAPLTWRNWDLQY